MAVVVMALAGSGCSIAFVNGSKNPSKCTRSMAVPLVDTALMAAAGGGVYATRPSAHGEDSDASPAFYATLGLFTAFFLSAMLGLHRVKKCKQRRRY